MLPIDTGGKIRSYNILRQLIRSLEVTRSDTGAGDLHSGCKNNAWSELELSQGGMIGLKPKTSRPIVFSVTRFLCSL
jgi:hypothetical protein